MTHYNLLVVRYFVSLFVIVLVPHYSADAASFISGLRERPDGVSSTSLLYWSTFYLSVLPVPLALLIWHLKLFILERCLLTKEDRRAYLKVFKIPSLFFYTAMPSKETFGLLVLVLSYPNIKKYAFLLLAFFKPHLSLAIFMRNYKVLSYVLLATILFLYFDEILDYLIVISSHFNADGTSTREYDFSQRNYTTIFKFFMSGMFNSFFIWSPAEILQSPLKVVFWVEALYCLFVVKKISKISYFWLFSHLIFLIFLQTPLSSFNPGSAIRYRTWIFLVILMLVNYNKYCEKVSSFKADI